MTTITKSLSPFRGAIQLRTSASWAAMLALGVVTQVGLRTWLSWNQVVPVANPDETGYLVGARFLAGGPGMDYSGNTFYQPGYPLLLSPAFWFTHDPETTYHLAIFINAVVSACAFPLAYILLRRLGRSVNSALFFGWTAALLPAATEFTKYTLADATLPVILLGWLLALHSAVRGSSWAAAVAGLIASYAYCVHA